MYLHVLLGLAIVLVCCVMSCISTLEWNASPGVQRLRRQVPYGGVCELPEPLEHGQYRPSYRRCPPGKQTPACLLLPGAYVPHEWILHFSCDKGYELNKNETVSSCVNGRWYPSLPVCIRAKLCPPLRSFGVEITCSYGGEIVSCIQFVIPGTVAALKCKDGYQHPYQSEPSQLTCQDSGFWDYPPFYCTPGCTPSDTLVNGKTVCKGDVVFEDTFNGPLNSKTWTRNEYFGSKSGQLKFSMVTKDIKNSFTENGKLVIRPTVNNNSYITSGSVELEGCTATVRENCVRTGSPDMVLPPVASAFLHTWKSFSFTYGEVEIRAKLPKGDWLMPWICLYSKYESYGDGWTSGCFFISTTLGNLDLQCSGKEYGYRRIQNMISLGPVNNVQYEPWIQPNINSEKWYNEYHNYTVIWKPESIAFKIDNQFMGGYALKNETLCDSYLTKEDCMIYNKGSKLAPYDKEFVIGFGLPAGDLWKSTDGCMNRGKVKPWKFNEPQAVTKFWQDRENWLPTWTEEGSSLYIDHVRVTAV